MPSTKRSGKLDEIARERGLVLCHLYREGDRTTDQRQGFEAYVPLVSVGKEQSLPPIVLAESKVFFRSGHELNGKPVYHFYCPVCSAVKPHELPKKR